MEDVPEPLALPITNALYATIYQVTSLSSPSTPVKIVGYAAIKGIR